MKMVGWVKTEMSVVRTLIQAVAGGTVSKLTGGKFMNGALTAAMQYTVNEIGNSLYNSFRSNYYRNEARTTYEPVVRGNIEAGVSRHGVSVTTDGESVSYSAEATIGKAGVVDIVAEVSVNSDGVVTTGVSAQRELGPVGSVSAGASVDSEGWVDAKTGLTVGQATIAMSAGANPPSMWQNFKTWVSNLNSALHDSLRNMANNDLAY